MSAEDCVAEAPAEVAPKRGRGRKKVAPEKPQRVFKHTASSGFRSDVEVFATIEREEGNVDPVLVMILLRAHQTLVATNRAQREVIGQLGAEIKRLKGVK